MSDQYYCFYPGDYHRDTGDLTMLEHGAYRTLLDHYYMQGGLDAQAMRLHRLCRAFTEEERQAVDNIVKRFFRSENGRLYNKKADEEIEKRRIFQEKMSERGKKGADARWKKQSEDDPQEIAQAMPQAMHKQCLADGIPSPSPSPSPTPIPKKELKEDGFTVPSFEDISLQSEPALWKNIEKAKDQLYKGGVFKDVHAFVNKMRKEKRNPRAILHTLTRCIVSSPDDPWPYCQNIMDNEHMTYNAKDYQRGA